MRIKSEESRFVFTYNGKTEWIQLASAADLKDPSKGNNDLDYLVSDLQAKLDKAFGGRQNQCVKADPTATPGQSSLSFKTTVPTNNNSIVEDKSSVLSLAAGERGLLGQYGALTGLFRRGFQQTESGKAAGRNQA